MDRSEYRKHNRRLIKAMIAAHPDAFKAMRETFHHSAEAMGNEEMGMVRFMLGQNFVIEQLDRLLNEDIK